MRVLKSVDCKTIVLNAQTYIQVYTYTMVYVK